MILLPATDLFSWKECLWFLDRRYDDCLYTIGENSLTKAVVLEGQPVLLRISSASEKGKREELQVEILHGKKVSEAAVASYVSDWFDLGRDLRPFYRLLKAHPRLSYMASEFRGLRLVAIPDLFEALCWAVIGQQINVPFAHTLKRRLVETYGSYIEFSGERHLMFPAPSRLASLSTEDLKALKFSRQKAEYIVVLSRAFASGEMGVPVLQALPDTPSRQKALTSLKGIGTWTANYVLMKSLREITCVPYGDVGLLNALVAHGLMADRSDVDSVHAFFSGFPGWESYAVIYLWRSLSPP